jgi:hypothetical protein
LCEQANNEQDPKKLVQLIDEINRLLEEKQERLEQLRFSQTKAPPQRQLGTGPESITAEAEIDPQKRLSGKSAGGTRRPPPKRFRLPEKGCQSRGGVLHSAR